MSLMSLMTRRMINLSELVKLYVDKLDRLIENNAEESPDARIFLKLFVSEINIFITELDKVNDQIHPGIIMNYTELRNELTSTFNRFSSIEGDVSSQQSIEDLKSIARQLLEKLKIVLANLQNIQYCHLIEKIQYSISDINKMGSVKRIENIDNIKAFGQYLLVIVETVKKCEKQLLSSEQKENLALYLHQLSCSFAMLVATVQLQRQHHLPVHIAKEYVCQRISLCLTMIIGIYQAECNHLIDGTHSYNDNHNSCYKKDVLEVDFIHKIDIVLNIVSYLNEMSNDEELLNQQCHKLWECVEDVLSHAMVIAQVSDVDNFKAISGGCQSIIEEFHNLKEEIGAGFHMHKSLLIDTFSDALYRLEKKVNICVLSLVLEVFSQPFVTLKKLVRMCTNYTSVETRMKEDLDDAVEKFDQNVDKIMQIGLYAIGSSNDINRVMQIKNHLASLESLESALIPSIISFYLDPRNEELRVNAKLLTTQWQLTLEQLGHTINLIIHPAVFCQVVWDDLQGRVLEISNNFSQAQVALIIERATALVAQLKVALEDIGIVNSKPSTIALVRELKAAIYETNAASITLLEDMGQFTEHNNHQLRVIKRCELLLSVVKRLHSDLLLVMNDIDQGKSQTDISETGPTNSASRCSKEDHSFGSLQQQKSNTALGDLSTSLKPYMEKARILRKDRTVIMYDTSKIQHKTVQINKMNRLIQHSHRAPNNSLFFHQYIFIRNNSNDNENSLDFSSQSWNLTAILDEISSSSIPNIGTEPNILLKNYN